MRIALAGNPNCGKTSLFNELTGAHQHVGNWSGVTVEVKEGTAALDGEKFTVVDLPGTYSLNAFSIEERVARDFIINEKPDAVINVIDATNLERNLYLTLQLLELGVRPVCAFNMWDEVRHKKMTVDVERLSELLGLTIIPTVGKTGEGIRELLTSAKAPSVCPARTVSWNVLYSLPHELAKEIRSLASDIERFNDTGYPSLWLAQQLFEHDKQVEADFEKNAIFATILAKRTAAAARVEKLLGQDAESLIAETRYGWIAGALRETVKVDMGDRVQFSDMIDKVVTHPLWAYPIFFFFMWLLFQATFVIGAYPMGWLEHFFAWLGDVATASLPDGNARSLVVDGIIGGVGGVTVFLPNIMILFFGIALMEDTGYMARSAFIMDKVMHRMGLHGKSFIPALMGMGCTVPAILAARTLESQRDRIKTILLAPLISCSARLPVYVLFAGALFPHHAGTVVFLFQFVLGITAFFLMGVLFKHTLFKGDYHPFVMELPPYRLPTAKSVAIHMWEKAKHYLQRMGGVVFAFSIILWFMGSFPKNSLMDEDYNKRIATVQSADISETVKQDSVVILEAEHHSSFMAQTYIGRMGKVLEPVVSTFGTDWRGAVALATGFVAKEVIVGSMGVLYAVGGADAADNKGLQRKISEHFSPLSGIAFLLFVLLYVPCMGAFVTQVRELKNWRWSVFAVVYQMGLAWGMATVVFQGGRLLGF